MLQYSYMKAVLFDFNGVIIDDEHLQEEAIRVALDGSGYTLSKDEFIAHFVGRSNLDGFASFVSAGDVSELLDRKRKVYSSLLSDKIPIIPEVIGFARRLHSRGFLLAIVSGSPKHEILDILDRMEIAKLFSVIISSDDVSKGKPDPEGYLLAAESLGVSSNKCVVIEDSPAGLEAAKRAGMKSIAINSTHSFSQLKAADRVVDVKSL